jgi:chromosome segregation ATPase
LSHLDSIQPVDESKFESSLTDLKNSIQTLKISTSESNSEQQSLESLISELETLKTDMTKTLASLKQQQQALADSLLQFQPLLKP